MPKSKKKKNQKRKPITDITAVVPYALLPSLPPYQFIILDHLRLGESNPEIAKAMKISLNTVISYIQKLMAKTGIYTRTKLAVWAIYNETNLNKQRIANAKANDDKDATRKKTFKVA